MAISTTENKQIYFADGSNRIWPFPYPVYEAEDLKLAITAPGLHQADIWLSPGEYQVKGLESGQVEVLYPISGAALPAGHKITLLRKLKLLSDFDPDNGARFNPEEVTEELDRHLMMIQQLQEGVDRAAKLPVSSEDTPPDIQFIFDTVEGIADAAVAAKEAAEEAQAGAEEARDEAQAAADSIRETSVALTTLSTAAYDVPHEEWPSAQYNPETNMIWFGVPRGRQGDTGEMGPVGPEGPQGDTGPQGMQGQAGLEGPQGPQGIQGEQGEQGEQGVQGEEGPQGIQGIQGVQGIKGDTGPQGLKGDKGDTGDTGPQGLQGIQGPKGDTGASGAKGDAGEQGPQGIQGLKGDAGIQGPKGDKGDTGLQGPMGPVAPGIVVGMIDCGGAQENIDDILDCGRANSFAA